MNRKLIGACVFLFLLSNTMAAGYIAILDVLVEISTILVVLFIFITYTKHLNAVKDFVFCIVLIFGFLLFFTLASGINSGIRPIVVMTVKSVAFAIIFSSYLQREPKPIFEIIAKATLILGLINIVLMILAPNLIGENRYFIASNRNNFPNLFLPGILAGFIANKSSEKNEKYYWLLLLVAFFTVVYVKSVTSIMGIGMILIYSILEQKISFIRKYSAIGLLVGIGLFFIIMILHNDNSLISQSKLIGKFLDGADKDITFSGRTWVWMSSLGIISENPFNGVGYYWGDWAMRTFHVANTHNIILEILLTGGMSLLIIISFLIIKLMIRVKKNVCPQSSYGIFFIFTVYLMMMQFEVYNYAMQFVFYFIVYVASKTYNNAKNLNNSTYLQSGEISTRMH